MVAGGTYRRLVRPALFRLDAERAYSLTIGAAALAGRTGLPQRWFGPRVPHDPRLAVRLAGLDLDNPLGLAAGLDKNGRAVAALSAVGFGHIEIGSISARPSGGNPRPRLFRIPADEALVVHYGVPNDGAEVVANRLNLGPRRVPLGINLVKTNDGGHPASTAEVVADFEESARRLAPFADYLMLNLSCPNTVDEGDFFDDPERVADVVHALDRLVDRTPVLLKIRPTVDTGRLADLVAAATTSSCVAGFSINLPAGKPPHLRTRTSAAILASRPGAVSGPPCEQYADEVLARLRAVIGPTRRLAIVASGGVRDADSAYRKLRLGADVVQLYTALVYRGPGLVADMLEGLLRCLDRDGVESLADLNHGR